jgi:hypothetical protein
LTTARTHEEVERRLARGLDVCLTRPHLIEHYRTNAACDLRAAWALGGTLFLLECEVKTCSRKPSDARLKPDQEAYRTAALELARLVALTPPIPTRAPRLMYAVFVYLKPKRKEPRIIVRTTSSVARDVLLGAWEAGTEALQVWGTAP